MKNRAKAVIFSLLGLTLISFIVQSQSLSYADTTAHSTNSSTAVTATVAASIHTCSWYLQNVPESIALSNPENLEYIGRDLPLEAKDLADISVYFSGAAEKNDRCSFYDEVTGVELAMSIDGTGFYNSGDTSLNWSFGESTDDGKSSFAVSFTEQSASCTTGFIKDFTAQLLNDGSGAPLSLTPVRTGPTLVSSNFLPYVLLASGPTFADCIMSANFQTSVPGGKRPGAPGTSYNFQGPTVTTTLTVVESD